MRNIKLLGVPFDFGQDHTGVRSAAEHLRTSGLISKLQAYTNVEDLGDINFPVKVPEKDLAGIKYSSQVSEANRVLSETIESMELQDSFLLNIGGDHGMALGSVHGVLSQQPETVVIWADAHGDINTPTTSPSGNFHGMPVAFLLKIIKDPLFGWIRNRLLPQKLIMIGPRDLDQGEIDLIQKYNIQYFSSDDMNRIGAQDLLTEALYKVDPLGIFPIHLSFDVDIFDKEDVTATGTKVANGPGIDEIFKLGRILGETGRLKSMDVVELNPELGTIEDLHTSTKLIIDFLELTIKTTFSQTGDFKKKEFLTRAFDKTLLS